MLYVAFCQCRRATQQQKYQRYHSRRNSHTNMHFKQIGEPNNVVNNNVVTEKLTSKHETLTQYWFNDGLPFATLAHH